MKILVAGNGMWPWYEPACANALKALGCDVSQIGAFEYFFRRDDGRPEPVWRSISARVQSRLMLGPILSRFNRAILNEAERVKPDAVFLYNLPYVFPETIKATREIVKDVKIIQYANDNPFSRLARKSMWRHFIASAPYCDLNLAYRPSNLADFVRAGARRTDILRPYYIQDQDYRVELTGTDSRFAADVVFAGHFEDDGRVVSLRRLLESGVRLNLFGGGWGRAGNGVLGDPLFRPLLPITPVIGDDYRKAVSGAKIALCFLSKLNDDVYTRRNFQIPAMGTFMLSEFSEDLSLIFAEGEEAEYFRSEKELLDKVHFYLKNDAARDRIARRGRERLLRDGHEVGDRMKHLLRLLRDESPAEESR